MHKIWKCLEHFQNTTEQTHGDGGEQYTTIAERTPLFSPGVPPTRFALPATRGKTSLNTRDW